MRTQTAAFLLSLLAASAAQATCVRPSGEPAVPDGAKADEEQMHKAHDALQGWVNQLEAYKACLSQQTKTAPPDTPIELKLTWLSQGDAAIDAANFAASQFSYALKRFKERQGKPEPAK